MTGLLWGAAALFLFWAALSDPAGAAASVSASWETATCRLLPSLFIPAALTGFVFESPLRDPAKRIARLLFSKPFRLPEEQSCAMLFALVCGYPMGIKIAVSLYKEGRIGRGDYERLTALTNLCGAGFIFSYAGSGIFGSARAGAAIFAAQLASALVISRILKPAEEPPPVPVGKTAPSYSRGLVKAVRQAASATAYAGAFVIFFGFVRDTLCRFFGGAVFWISAALELSNGAAEAPAVSLCAAAVGWGGLSVHAQSAAAAGDAGLGRKYIPVKLLNAVLCWGFGEVFCRILL